MLTQTVIQSSNPGPLTMTPENETFTTFFPREKAPFTGRGLRASLRDLRAAHRGLRDSPRGLRASQRSLRASQRGQRASQSGLSAVHKDECTEFLPILQDFVPHWGRCQKCAFQRKLTV